MFHITLSQSKTLSWMCEVVQKVVCVFGVRGGGFFHVCDFQLQVLISLVYSSAQNDIRQLSIYGKHFTCIRT